MEQKTPRPRYDPQKRSKASISGVLRFIVAFYIAYLGWTIARTSGPGTSMSKGVGWCFCALFMAVGIAFGVYALKRYQADLKAAELPEDPADGESARSGTPEDGEDPQ